MSEHTKGPWEVEYVVDGAFVVRGTVEGDKCVLAARNPFPERHGEFMQNAHLIAAAPEMLAALRLIESVYRQNCVVEDEPSSVLEAVQAAIAKAEGRQ